MNLDFTLPQMRRIATGSLLFCILAMALAKFFEPSLPALAWLTAFFEAATVGAMADWFAVVALFRHPMGIKIPHTAILPANKNRVGESLASFLDNSFLTPEQLGPRFRKINYAAFSSQWLKNHSAMLADKAASFAPNILSGFSDEEMTSLLSQKTKEMIRKTDVAPLLGEGIEIMAKNGRDREIFTSLIKSSRQMIEEHRPLIQSKIREEIPLSSEMLGKLLPMKELFGPVVDSAREKLASLVAEKSIQKVQATLDEAVDSPTHSLWLSFEKQLHNLIGDLKFSEEMKTKVREMQNSLADGRLVDDFAMKTWRELKEFLLADCAAENSLVRQKIESSILSLAGQLEENDAWRTSMNRFLGEQILAYALSNKHHVRELVVSTVNEWDAEEMAEKLEDTVGRDLQFIRLNGTVVGGIMGLAIHGIFWLLGK